MMPNLLQYPVALFGVLRAGMIVVNVNPLYTGRELEHQLNDSGAEGIVILENFAHVLQTVLPRTELKTVITTQVGDLLPPPRRSFVNYAVKRLKKMVPPWRIEGTVPFRAVLNQGRGLALAETGRKPDDIALLQYTGGTTGTSKGAILTHRNMVANVLQASAWANSKLREGSETVVTAIPLYHIFSLTVNCLLFIRLGALNVLITNPRDLPAFVREMRKSRFTTITGVNTLYNGLLNTPGFSEVDFSDLRLAIGGGAAIQRTVAERWHAVTGCHLTEGYGLTEAAPLVACNPFGSPHSGAIGLPVPSTDVSIRDEADCEMPPGAEGEICVKGPQVMAGYWNRPEETASAFTPGGWLRTGDVGVIDEMGYLRVTDRKKDIILVSGFNVYPTEVEDVICSMPGVVESAVIGMPDAATGESVKAIVVRSDPSVSAEATIAFCRQRLTRYKVPKTVEFCAELPKNPIGKILRRQLRAATAGAAVENERLIA
jgi:long-chain acyl-CoA synthetase